MKKDLVICGARDDCDTLKDKLDSLYDFNITKIISNALYYPLNFMRRHIKDSDILLVDVEDFKMNTYAVISFALAYDVEIVGYYKDTEDKLNLQLARACDCLKHIDNLEEYFG